jgi:hypothetical protein
VGIKNRKYYIKDVGEEDWGAGASEHSSGKADLFEQ